MIPYNQNYFDKVFIDGKDINVFTIDSDNIDLKTVSSFGDEWTKFNYFSEIEIKVAGDQYFDIVAPEIIKSKYILDIGCGTGRWTKYLAGRAKFIDSIDPSTSVFAAAKLLKDCRNVRISRASIDNLPFLDGSFDFVFSLGVLHHIPDTAKAMKDCVKKVKKGGYFLVYLYYNLDNRGFLFKLLYRISNKFRGVISMLPSFYKKIICDFIAFVVYIPLVCMTILMKAIGLKTLARHIPLSYYSDKSLNLIRTDALDRFGTPLEKRFTKGEVEKMMKDCGLKNVIFSDNEPFWHAMGQNI